MEQLHSCPSCSLGLQTSPLWSEPRPRNDTTHPLRCPTSHLPLAMHGLTPEAVYQVDYFTGESRQLSGRELASLVIRLEQPRSFQIISYRVLKNRKQD